MWKNGNIYMGQWMTGSRCGSGGRHDCLGGHSLLMHAADRGTMHGAGSYLYLDGVQYVGEFQHGVRCGNGKQIWPSGHVYVGEWSHDTPHGHGMFVDGTSGAMLTGRWHHGCLVEEVVEQVIPGSSEIDPEIDPEISLDSAGNSSAAVAEGDHRRREIEKPVADQSEMMAKESSESSSSWHHHERRQQVVAVGVQPTAGHEIHIAADASGSSTKFDNHATGQRKEASTEGMRRHQIQIRTDGTIYVGTTWRGVNHGDGVHVSATGKERQGPWTIGCSASSRSSFCESKEKSREYRSMEHANRALCMQKESLRSQSRRMLVPRGAVTS